VNGDWVVTEECVAVQYEKPMNLDHASFFKWKFSPKKMLLKWL